MEHIETVLEWHKIIEQLDSRTASAPGKLFCQNIAPLNTADARARLEKISALKSLFIEHDRPVFSGFEDIDPLLVRAKKGAGLTLAELFSVRRTVSSLERIRQYVESNREFLTPLDKLTRDIVPLAKLDNLLTRSITDNGEISSDAYPELRRIQKDIAHTKADIESRLQKFVHSSAMDDVLQEKIFTERGGRYVVLAKANMKGRVHGVVQDISSSGQTLYMELDSIAPLNRILLERMLDYELEIQRIVNMLAFEAAFSQTEIAANSHVAAELDFLTACARLSNDIAGSEPELLDEPVINLFSARHPLLHLMKPGSVIANDIALGKTHDCLIISGANTGGKTVLLKTIGISALMAQHGLHISASPDSQIGIFTTVIADIGDDQSLSASLSTYSAQIVSLKRMIERADKNSLLLIDEIVVGTNPRQGETLARAILERMIESGAKIIVTTHYGALKDLAASDPRFQNASVSFDLDSLKPTYHLSVGIPGLSYTFEIAELYGIGEQITSRAKALLSSSELSVDALIEKIRRYETELIAEREKTTELYNELSRDKEKIR